MDLLINTSSINKGGGVQVAISFLESIKNDRQHSYHVALSKEVLSQIKTVEYSGNFNFYKCFTKNGGIKKIWRRYKQLKKIEKEINPDVTFTIFGPAYWKPKSKHVIGFAYGHYIYPDSPYFERLSFAEKIKLWVKKNIHVSLFKYEYDNIIVETEDAKNRIGKYIGIPEEKINVVSNTYNQVYDQSISTGFLPNEDKFQLLLLSSFYPHKNFEIIKNIATKLKIEGSENIQFVLTIEESKFDLFFNGLEDYVINVGYQPIEKCPSLYDSADAVFFPSLLETFSAVYLEAMKMEKPIITSDLSFAHDICGDAALYFDPLNADDGLLQIKKLINDPPLKKSLISKGQERLQKFPTANERAKKYLEICCEAIN